MTFIAGTTAQIEDRLPTHKRAYLARIGEGGQRRFLRGTTDYLRTENQVIRVRRFTHLDDGAYEIRAGNEHHWQLQWWIIRDRQSHRVTRQEVFPEEVPA